jgi:ParB/RepB/Spo0J family partition protein
VSSKRKDRAGGQLGLASAGVDLLNEADAARRASELRLVDPRKIKASPVQPRSDFQPERLAELTESVRTHGVLQPLLVRQLADGSLQLLAGERRQRAALAAGVKRVPVRVLEVPDATAAAITLTENLAREDLTPWEEALGLGRLQESMVAMGMKATRDEIARMVGRSGGAVSESLQIAARLSPLVEVAGIDGQTLTKMPKTALHGASQGRDDMERVKLLRLAASRVGTGGAPGRAVATAARTRGRPAKPWKVNDRLKDRGTLSFSLRRRPEEFAPEEARDALNRLDPLLAALRRRAEDSS